MVDRAHYLARTLLARLMNLRASCAEDGRGEPDRAQRLATLEKVLAVELGVTDAATLGTIEAALPDLKLLRAARDQEVAALAELLRRRLGTQLAR
jgi:hypothetical protein